MKTLFLPALLLLLAGCASLNSRPMARGAVCFTFDDYSGANWLKADKIFKKYNAHVTFFVSGAITPEKAAVMKQLQDAGHSVGLHSIRHRNAVPLPANWTPTLYFEKEIAPQLEVCRQNGIDVRGFAYPNNRRSDETDAELFKHFDYLRAGKGKEREAIFYTQKELKDKMVLGGAGIGKYYKSDVNKLKQLLRHAAETGTLVVFFSHNIYPKATGVSMPTEMLEELLKTAVSLKMKIVGINELKTLK